ncbi:hypothetical protein BDZ91DRAFT_793320 [Kalaharituber pfeilii]|nr:hypothetical protein BDZ91DRAFT_793320 [Kalaharituber pfeilii]
MSLNWVMLDERGTQKFVNLPGEKTLYTSPPRVSFQLKALSYTGKNYSLKCGDGLAYVTNSRIIYIPSSPTACTPSMESFCAPLKNVYDSYVTAPFFGPNVWVSTIRAVRNGNIPDGIPELELKLTFKDGGTFDFHNHIEHAKECMPQEMEFGDVTDPDLPSYDGSPPGIVPQWTPDVGPSAAVPPPPPPDGPPPGYEEAQIAGVSQGLESYTSKP